MAPVGLNMAEHFRLPQRMILGGLKGGLKIPRHPNHLNFIDEFKGLVRSRRLELPRDIIPQRPQRCASTNSATTAKSGGYSCVSPRQERAISKGFGTLQAASPDLFKYRKICGCGIWVQPGFQPISAAFADLGTSVTASLILTLSPGASRCLGDTTSQL